MGDGGVWRLMDGFFLLHVPCNITGYFPGGLRGARLRYLPALHPYCSSGALDREHVILWREKSELFFSFGVFLLQSQCRYRGDPFGVVI